MIGDTRYEFGDLLPVVGNQQRRRILLAVKRARTDADALRELLADDGRNRDDDLALELHHVHLPMLEDHGFVRWDRDDGAVRRGPTFHAIEPLLDVIDAHGGEVPREWLAGE